MTVISMRARENRRDRRRAINMILDHEGQDFTVVDCSLGGLMIEGGCGLFEPDSDVTASLKTPNGDIEACQSIPLRVVRVDHEADRVAFHFVGLGDACFSALERHLTGRGDR